MERPVLILSCRTVFTVVLQASSKPSLRTAGLHCTCSLGCEWRTESWGVLSLSLGIVPPDLPGDPPGFAQELCWEVDGFIAGASPLSVPFLPQQQLVMIFLWSPSRWRKGNSCSSDIPRSCAWCVSSEPQSQSDRCDATRWLQKESPHPCGGIPP